jgi:serine protease AprX
LKTPKHYRLRRWLVPACLSLAVCAGAFAGGSRVKSKGSAGSKISPDLRATVAASQDGDEGRNEGDDGTRVNVIVQQNVSGQNSVYGQTAAALPVQGLDSLLDAVGARVTRRFRKLGVLSVSLPPKAVAALASRADVRYVSPDRALEAAGHVETTTGTSQVRTQTLISLLGIRTTTTLDGSGIGIAVVDSGVDAAHESFRDALGLSSRVAYSQDFTGEGRTDDPYGHGTHVASLAAGAGAPSGGAYTGVAPGASLVNLRVLDSQGRGTTSALLSALEWVLANRALYNIRVVNISIGTPAVEDYHDDPVCNAVRALVDAGVVVVAAAGNSGKDAAGNKVYGQIHSPGDEPSAITVGASNTFGTDARSDDGVTTYSSRGPTRGYWTDDGGARHYDNLLKPELIAPGNKIIGAASSCSNLLAAHPELNVDASQPASRRMMYLSGTSMATPVVAGASALVLQANPSLTPNLVKAVLMLTAQPLAGFNTLEQGAGEVNVEGAVRLAELVRTDLNAFTPLGSPLLSASAPATQTSVAGQTFQWSQGLVLDHTYVAGPELYTLYQRVYATGCVLGDGVTESGGAQSLNPTLLTGGVRLGAQLLTSDGSTLAGGSPFLDRGRGAARRHHGRRRHTRRRRHTGRRRHTRRRHEHAGTVCFDGGRRDGVHEVSGFGYTARQAAGILSGLRAGRHLCPVSLQVSFLSPERSKKPRERMARRLRPEAGGVFPTEGDVSVVTPPPSLSPVSSGDVWFRCQWRGSR